LIEQINGKKVSDANLIDNFVELYKAVIEMGN